MIKVSELNSDGTLVELTQEDMIKTHNDLVQDHNDLLHSYIKLSKEFLILQKQYNELVLSMIVPTEAIQ
jgi:hypothetical protein